MDCCLHLYGGLYWNRKRSLQLDFQKKDEGVGVGGLSVLCSGPAPVTMGADDQVGECPSRVVHVVVFAVDVVVVVGGGGEYGRDDPDLVDNDGLDDDGDCDIDSHHDLNMEVVVGCGCPDIENATILPFGDVSAFDLILTEFLFQLSSRIQRLGHEGRKDMGRLESWMMMLPYMLISNFVWTQKNW